MKLKALANIFQDERGVVTAGDSFEVDRVNNYKGMVTLKGEDKDGKPTLVSVSIEVFNTFFKADK